MLSQVAGLGLLPLGALSVIDSASAFAAPGPSSTVLPTAFATTSAPALPLCHSFEPSTTSVSITARLSQYAAGVPAPCCAIDVASIIPPAHAAVFGSPGLPPNVPSAAPPVAAIVLHTDAAAVLPTAAVAVVVILRFTINKGQPPGQAPVVLPRVILIFFIAPSPVSLLIVGYGTPVDGSCPRSAWCRFRRCHHPCSRFILRRSARRRRPVRAGFLSRCVKHQASLICLIYDGLLATVEDGGVLFSLR